jgi:hypothetical protein
LEDLEDHNAFLVWIDLEDLEDYNAFLVCIPPEDLEENSVGQCILSLYSPGRFRRLRRILS